MTDHAAEALAPLQGDYRGRVAVVTGSTQGIGAEIATTLARWGAAGLVVCGRNAEQGEHVRAEIEKAGAKAVFVRADLSNIEDGRAVMTACEQAFGRLDGLVNAAALTDRATLDDATPEFWDRVFALNARAPFFLMQQAAALMRRGGRGGAIVNIQSMNALVGHANLAIYSSSKGALSTLTKNSAHALRHDRIRVNGINLGWADTPAEHVVQEKESPLGKGWLEAAEKAQPFGRLIKVRDVAEFVAFLISDHAGIMTGAVIDYEQWVAGAPPTE